MGRLAYQEWCLESVSSHPFPDQQICETAISKQIFHGHETHLLNWQERHLMIARNRFCFGVKVVILLNLLERGEQILISKCRFSWDEKYVICTYFHGPKH